DRLTYLDVLAKDLKVMDQAAISLTRENDIPIVVFSLLQKGALLDVLHGRGTCTIIAANAKAN
ncbi:MAG: UMP kinase, partial [Pseudomonadota bacterium]